MPDRKRFLLYAQHLSGTGHFVRMYEIARALSATHDVSLIDGGRIVPRPEASFERLTLPRIYRGSDGRLASMCLEHSIAQTLDKRHRLLKQAIGRNCPDFILIEDFPFSKWEMAQEILALIYSARAFNSRLKVVCSLRDISARKKHHYNSPDFQYQVRKMLVESFDLILVHSDPEAVRIEDTLAWASDIEVPIRYTGFVSQKCRCRGKHQSETASRHSQRAIVSSGGAASQKLIPWALEAWNRAISGTSSTPAELLVFAPAFARPEEIDHWKRAAVDPGVCIKSFSASFLDEMESAGLSISHAGYNTCMNILETRTHAILLPNPEMKDQEVRANLFARHGLAEVVNLDSDDPEKLATAIVRSFRMDTPKHQFDLNGAERTKELLERL